MTPFFVIQLNLIVNGGCSDVFLDTQFDSVKLRTQDLIAFCLGCAIPHPWPTRFLFSVNSYRIIIAAAETSATAPTQALVARNLKKLGFFSAFTTPAPSLRARQDQQVSLRGKATGCANFSLFPMRFARCPKLVDPGMDLRFMHIIVDEWKLQIITIYGLTSSHVGAQDFNNALLALAAQRVKQVNLPAIVMGDFNADVSKLLASHEFAQMGFLHLQQLYANMYGEAMPPSCKEATNPDTAFLSPELASRLTAISVMPDSLFDAHKVVTFRLNISEGPWLKQIWPRPKAFTSFALPAKTLEALPRICRVGGHRY